MAYFERIVVVGAADLAGTAAEELAQRFGPVHLIGPGADRLAEIGVRRYPGATVRSFDLDTPAVIVDNDGGRTQRIVCDRLVVAGWPEPLLPPGRWIVDGKVVVTRDAGDIALLGRCLDCHGHWRPALADYQHHLDAGALA